MPFDPSQPFDLLDASPAFDPSKPFEVVDDSFESQLKGGEIVRPLLEAELEAEASAPAPTTKQQIGYGLRRGVQAAGDVAGNILQVPAIIGTRVVGGKQEEQPLYRMGEWIKQNARNRMLAMYQEGDKTAELLRSNVLTEDVPAGVGSSLAFLVGGGPVGRALGSARGGVATVGALTGAGAQADEARAFKASPNQEFVAALLGAGLGLTEAVGIGSVAARLDKASGGTFSKGVQSRLLTFGKNVSKETVEEMLQEGVQALGEDVIAKSLAGYDPERELGKELWDRVQAGGISGALISGLTSFGVRPRRVIQEPTTQLKPGDVIPGTERNDAITTRTAEEVLDEGATVARVPGDGQNRQNIAQVVAPRTADSAGDSAPGEVGAVVPPEVAPGPQVAPVVYRGYQEGFRNVPGYHLYNLTADLGPKLVKGSTVTEESLLKAGYTIPEAEKAKAVAPAPTVTQPTTKLERGVWSGGDVGQEPITALRLNDGTVLIDPEARIHATAFENLGVDPTTVADGGFVRGTEYKTSGADTARIVRQAVARKALAAKKPTTTSAPPADVAPQVPKSSLETINSAARVKLALPEGATFVRGTDARGKVAVQPVASFKNANPFRQAGIVTLEAGTNTRTGFVPMKGEVSVTDLAQAQIAQAPKAANPPKPTGLRRGQDWRYLDPNVVATSTKPAKPPRPATVKQEFDKLALDYAVIHKIPHDPLVSEDVRTIDGGARSTHNAEVQRLRRVVFSALGLKGDTMDNAALSAALPKLKEAIAKREAEISAPQADETEADRGEFPAGTSTDFLPAEETKPDLELATPETVEQQKARQAAGEATAKAKADKEKLAEGATKPLVGKVGDIGQTDLLGGGDLFSAPTGVLASLEASMTPEERAELASLEAELTKKLGQHYRSGVDPTIVTTGGRIAFLYAKAGVRQFRDFATRMLEKFGEAGRRYLMTWYNNARMQAGGEGWTNEAEAQRIYDAEFAGRTDATAESRRAVPETTGGTGAKRSPVARVVRRELIPEPRAYVRTDSYAAKSGYTLDAEQVLGANQILTHFLDRNAPAFLLGDNPGFGKTAQIFVAADQFVKARPGARVLYVTQNEQMIKGTVTGDTGRMGIDLGQFEIATYSQLHALKRRDFDLVIFDEAHNIKNGEARKSMAAARIRAPHTLFSTATPMDRPSGAAYFLAEIAGKDETELANELGYTFQEKTDPYTQEIHTYAVLKPGFSWAKVWSNIMAYRDASIRGGAMLRRDYPFYGSVNVQRLPMDRRAKMEQETIEKYYDMLVEQARTPSARRNYAGQKTLTLRRWAEQQKIEEAFRQAQEHLAAGGQVIIMAETDKAQSFPVTVKGGVVGLNDKGREVWRVPGAIERLTALFNEAGIQVAHIHDTTKYSVASEVDKFQTGKVPVALATPKSGGAGINLDDIVGTRPRLMLILSKSLAGDTWDQALGRVSRKTTQSEARVEVLTLPDSYGDQRADDILDKKIRTLRAIQGGEDLDTAAGFEAPPAEAGKPSDTANQIADSLEKLKAADPLQGNVSLFGLTQSVWNTAISIAQGIVRAGGKLADAVAAALAHIRANHKGDWDEAGATAALEASAQENADTDRDEQKFTSSPEFKANAELADELGIIRPDDDHSAATGEGVLTKVGNVHDVVLSRPGLNDAVRRNSVAAAKAALEEAGLNIVRAPDGLWKLANESTSQEAAGEKLVPILEREIQAARAEDRRERLANLLNSIAVHLGRDKNGAFSQSLKNRLYALAQGERSSFGRALGALAMWGKVLANVAQNPEIHLARIYSEAVTDADTETVIEKIKEAVAKPTPTEREASLKKIRAELTPKQRKKFKSKTLWDRVQRAARAGLFDENGILEELAREQGFTVPTEEQKAQMRDWVDEEERLRTPTARQIAKAGGDMDKATKETLAGTETERLALIKKIQAHWSRWALPTSWNPLKWRNLRVAQNNAKAVDEFVGANLLFKLGFATRQLIDVALVSAPLHAANRSLAHVLERAQNDGGLSADTLKDLQGAMKEMATARIASLKATVRSMERTLTGHTDRKTLDRMNHSIGVFERMNAKADALFASGNKAASYAVRFATILRAGYRVAEVLDAFQAVGLEWQEMRQQLSTDLRAQGKSRAEIAAKLDDIFGGLKVDMLQAVEEVRAIKGERGLEPDEKNIEQDAWALLKARAYDRMRQATGLSTDYRGENETLAQLHAWNLPETGGIGGLLAETIKGIRSRTQKSGIPTGGLFSFGNAIGIAANRMATFSGLGLFGGWGFGDSPWYQGARNIRQRRIEAVQGLAAVGLLTALAAAGKILVQVKYPDDKDEKEKFIAEGHKLNTIKFINDDGTWIEYPIQMSPFSFIAGPAYMIGGVQRLFSQRQREQDRLNADAARTGATPGKARAIGSGDIAGVIAQGMYGMLTGGRTASGAIQSFSDYGDFNLNKSASALLRPYIPAAPAWQEASRLMGVTMDTRTASLFELLVPTPSSPHQRVNSLGDPMVNPNDGLRVLQVLSGGIGFGREGALPETHAYRQIFASGYSTPDVGRTKGYNFGGVVRPMTPQELDRYAVARGQAFKRELEGVNVEGQPEAEARKTVQAAFQRANSAALREVGVQAPSRAESRASGRPASGGVASGGSFGSVSPSRAGRLPTRRLARGSRRVGIQRSGRVRLSRGIRRGRRLSRGLRRQPRLGRVRRLGLSRVSLRSYA